MYALGWEVGKLRDQNRELDERDEDEGRDSRLRRKSQCRVVSLPPLPLPWLSVERKCLSKYVAHMFTPLPSHVVAMCSGPRAHMLMAARCVCNSRHSKHPWDPRFRPVARVLIRPFLNFPI